MGYKNHDDHAETAMNQLSDSVLGLSDEAIADEIAESGADPDEEAERTRSVLHTTSKAWALQGACVERVQSTIPQRKASSPNR